jgi:hypothetical protein
MTRSGTRALKQTKHERRIAEIRLPYWLSRLRSIAVARLVSGATEAIFREGMHMDTTAVEGLRPHFRRKECDMIGVRCEASNEYFILHLPLHCQREAPL